MPKRRTYGDQIAQALSTSTLKQAKAKPPKRPMPDLGRYEPPEGTVPVREGPVRIPGAGGVFRPGDPQYGDLIELIGGALEPDQNPDPGGLYPGGTIANAGRGGLNALLLQMLSRRR